jgi:hypothetical protein
MESLKEFSVLICNLNSFGRRRPTIAVARAVPGLGRDGVHASDGRLTVKELGGEENPGEP